MSWLRSSPLRQSFSRTSANSTSSSALDSTSNDCDPKACYDSFCKHWQQVFEIIQRGEKNKAPTHDDVLGVVNHLDHMVTLLLLELHNYNEYYVPNAQNAPPAPCLEYLLSENLLDKLYEWGNSTGRYANAVRLEQLKLYEQLVTHSRHQLLLVHEPFLKPLLKMLASSQDEIFPTDVEKRLVILLNQLCVVLMQNVHLLDLFFFSSSQQNQCNDATNFIIFSLLIPYVHREGSLGHQARDALLLCMALSQKNSNVGTYIAQYSSMCPVLVTGLGGLYSSLPNSFEVLSNDWYRITPDDVAEIPKLTSFMNSLEFCNAVVQVSHNLIKQQLLDFMYQGFIVPILGPALLQIFKGNPLQTNFESQIAAMAYLDLILRSVTEPALLKIFVRFLLDDSKFDGQRILDTLVEHLSSSNSRLCIVTLSVFDTLLSLCCEDIILELLLKFLIPCKHVPIMHRHKINKFESYASVVDLFLDLSPEILKQFPNSLQPQQQQQSSQQQQALSKTIGANWNHYCLHTGESKYSNFHAYLFDAHYKIRQCKNACSHWSNTYQYQKTPTNKKSERTMEMIKNLLSEFAYESFSNTNGNINNNNGNYNKNQHNDSFSDKSLKQLDSLQSLGESSGYESLRYRPEEEDSTMSENSTTAGSLSTTSKLSNKVPLVDDVNSDIEGNLKRKSEVWKMSIRRPDASSIDLDFSEDLFTQGTVSLGPFLNSLLKKLQTFTSNGLFVNLHLTGLISKLAWYPLSLVHSIFLRPDIPTTSDTPSFHQVLKLLKQQIDAELPINEETFEQIDNSRATLIDREFRLVNSRKNAIELSKNSGQNITAFSQTSTANISSTTPPQLTPSSSYDPFRRTETNRKGLKNSISNIFRWQKNLSNPAAAGLSHIVEFFTSGSPSIQLRETSVTPIETPLNDLSESPLESLSIAASPISLHSIRTKELALCAIILDEWIKELAAISQEQYIVMMSTTTS